MVIVYDLNMKPAAVLENAYKIGYSQKLNSLWTAKFTLPLNDSKNTYCTAYRFVEIYDGEESIGIFRIIPSKIKKDSSTREIYYECEHVLATLLDDLLFQYHECVNLTTTEVLSYLLSFQSNIRWKLGKVDFSYQYSYKWETENILGSLFSVPKCFVEDYQWTWDTSSMPWTLNLIAPNTDTKTYIRYGRNLEGIEKDSNPANICTRIYPLGYGEGVNQLTITSVNNDLPYLDADTISTYGIIAVPYIDKTEEDAAALKQKAEAVLEKAKTPYISYSLSVKDIYKITEKSIDKFYIGAYSKAIDDEDNIEFSAKVITITKDDITDDPGDAKIEIASKSQDIAQAIADIRSRQKIQEVYAQGATNIDSNDYEDNCDATHPAVIKFYIPSECVRINKCLLSYSTGKFRAYETGAASGGSSTSGASSKSTSDSGGGSTSGASSKSTSDTGGSGTVSSDYTSGAQWDIGGGFGISEVMATTSSHNHGISNGTALQVDPSGSVVFTASGSHSHGLAKHKHTFDLPGHSHGMDHTHQISTHSHGMDHTHQISAHTHDITYGIYERSEMPEYLTIKVDGRTIPTTDLNGNDIDIISYLDVDSNGKIKRGQFHVLEITPNNLARITATVVKQLFLQSRGGGDY